MSQQTPHFEQGPIRPPSEAHSLLVRVTRNCAWNRCAFCPVYKGAKFSLRSAGEIEADVDAMAEAARVLGETGEMTALHQGLVPREAYQVAFFLRGGGRTVFLQDADSVALRPDKLAEVVARVRERFPSVARVTTYGRGATLARRSVEQLRLVREAGLTRVHVGLESGSDEVLRRMDKGCTAARYVEAGRHVLEAGLELCLYVMPGLGGRGEAAAAQHVAGTADVVRRVAEHGTAGNRLVVRLRTAAVAAGTPLAEAARDGRFTLPDDVEVARELRALLVALGDAPLRLVSDHALNLLPEIDGVLPADRDGLMEVIDEFLALPSRERAEFVLGRRLGIYYSLASRLDPQRRATLAASLPRDRVLSEREMLDTAVALRARYI
jgi:hypothetical protein